MTGKWTCVYCKKKFDSGASICLCSIECADLRAIGLKDNYHNEYTECLSCGKRLSTIRPRKFCDKRCSDDYKANSNPVKVNIVKSTKRVGFDKETVSAVMKEYGYTCVYCGGTAEAIDHVYPVCKGGTNDRRNLVASCDRCNSIASGKDFRSVTEKQQYILSRR